MSDSTIPRLVTAGVPNRIPLALNGERVSPGTVFLFVVIFALSSAFWASLPVSSGWLLRKSIKIKWLSVPPETRPNPFAFNASANAAAFFLIWLWYSLKESFKASPKHTALPAITCIKGPPWIPGKIAESIALAYSSRHIMMPPRGPRNVLWVVVVTKSQ